MDDLHTGGSYAFQGKPGNYCVSEYGEIRTVHVGKCIRTDDVLDRASALAFLHAAVRIFKSWNSSRSRSLKHGRKDRIGDRRWLDINRSSCSAAFRVGRTTPVFNANRNRVENNMRTNYNRTTGEAKTLGKKTENPLT